MSLIRKGLSSIVFKRIVIIFVVGLFSRGLVNLVYDINVFKDYTTSMSLMYYLLMACFSGFIYELPSISFNVFNFNIVRSAIRVFASGMSDFGGKISNPMFTPNGKVSVDKMAKDSLNFYIRRPSAGIIGLYQGDNSVSGNNSVNSNPKHSLGNVLRCRVLWYTWVKNSGNFVSYKEYENSFNPRFKVSMVEEIKNRSSKR